MKLHKKNNLYKTAVWVISLVVLCSFFFFLNSTFQTKEPDDKRLIFVFEEYSQVKFPKSGKVLNKNFTNGINDGLEAAIIYVDNVEEFLSIKNKIKSQKEFVPKIKKAGTGYFNSEILDEKNVIDTIFNNFRESFLMVFINKEKKIVFEKRW